MSKVDNLPYAKQLLDVYNKYGLWRPYAKSSKDESGKITRESHDLGIDLISQGDRIFIEGYEGIRRTRKNEIGDHLFSLMESGNLDYTWLVIPLEWRWSDVNIWMLWVNSLFYRLENGLEGFKETKNKRDTLFSDKEQSSKVKTK